MGEWNQRREDGDEPEIRRRYNTARWEQGRLDRTCGKSQARCDEREQKKMAVRNHILSLHAEPATMLAEPATFCPLHAEPATMLAEGRRIGNTCQET